MEMEWEGNRQTEGTVCFPVACSCIAIMEGRSIRESIGYLSFPSPLVCRICIHGRSFRYTQPSPPHHLRFASSRYAFPVFPFIVSSVKHNLDVSSRLVYRVQLQAAKKSGLKTHTHLEHVYCVTLSPIHSPAICQASRPLCHSISSISSIKVYRKVPYFVYLTQSAYLYKAHLAAFVDAR